MIALPAALAPWRRELETYPPEIALTVGGWLPRLASAVGAMRQRASDDGEPDGLDGLDRRGPYERLLLSEWGLADELPEEFLRRAAAGEHAFTALARRQSGARRRSLLLFDAGPDQLGAPRIAQLALLIVLAQRARVAGAKLVWGAAQHPDRQLGEVTPQSILWLLQARSLAAPSPAAVDAWLARTAATRDDDVWLVGGAGLRRVETAAAGRVTVRDVLAVDRRAVALEVERTGRAIARVELALPPVPAAVRLLRDPFRATRAEPARSVGAIVPASLRFAADGRRLLARRTDGAVVAWHIPRTPREPMGRTRVLRAGGGILAVERAARRSALFLEAREDGVLLHGATSAGPQGILFPHPEHPEDRIEMDPLGRLHALHSVRQRGWILLDGAGSLHRLTQRDAGDGAIQRVAGVVAVRPHGWDYLTWLHLAGELKVVQVAPEPEGGALWRAPCPEPTEVVVGPAHAGIGAVGLFAYRVGSARWRIPGSGDEVEVAADDLVLSIAQARSHALALVVIDQDRTCVAMRSAPARDEFHRAQRTIVHACAAPGSDLVGAVEDSGLVWVYSLDQRARLMVVTPEEVAGR